MHDLEIGHWPVKFHDLLILWGFDIHPLLPSQSGCDLSQAVKGTPCRAPSVARGWWEVTLCSAHCSQALSTGAEDRQGCVHPGDPADGGSQGAVLEHRLPSSQLPSFSCWLCTRPIRGFLRAVLFLPTGYTMGILTDAYEVLDPVRWLVGVGTLLALGLWLDHL